MSLTLPMIRGVDDFSVSFQMPPVDASFDGRSCLVSLMEHLPPGSVKLVGMGVFTFDNSITHLFLLL